MGREDMNQLPVISDGHPQRVITRGHLLRFLAAQAELGCTRNKTLSETRGGHLSVLTLIRETITCSKWDRELKLPVPNPLQNNLDGLPTPRPSKNKTVIAATSQNRTAESGKFQLSDYSIY